MSRTILGLSAFYHDSAAAQEERFSRKKHDPRFPRAAINYCLEEAFIEQEDLDAIVFYDSPLLTWDRIVKNCLAAGEALLLAVSDRLSLGILLCGRVETEHLAKAPEAAKVALGTAEVIAAELGAGPESELGLGLARVRDLLGHGQSSRADDPKAG